MALTGPSRYSNFLPLSDPLGALFRHLGVAYIYISHNLRKDADGAVRVEARPLCSVTRYVTPYELLLALFASALRLKLSLKAALAMRSWANTA
jgi:hypothetical protein